MQDTRFSLLAIVLVAGLLTGCQGKVSVDLTTTPPGDRDILQVVAGVLGLEFSRSDGSTETLEFTASESVDFMEFRNGDLLTLFTNEPLPAGTYTGVRLLFDANADGRFVTDGLAGSAPLLLVPGDYADFDFTVEDEESSSASLTLTLDLRQSLSFNATNDEYTLQPYLRSVLSADAGVLEGFVSIVCPAGASLLEGGAVYLFQGQDIVPDDRDGNGIEPYATGSLIQDLLTDQFSYQLLDLPAGEYTIAATCNGDLEDPTTDTLLTFRGTRNVNVSRDSVTTASVTG